MSDPDEAVLAMWAQGELPGAVKPVSNLYVGTVCNCGENMNLNLFLKFVFVQEVSGVATAAAAVDEAEPTAGPSGLCGRRREAQPSPDPSFMDAVEEVCKNYYSNSFKKYVPY